MTDVETRIRTSAWWRDACAMPDRHHPSGSGVFVADHLNSVHDRVSRILLHDAQDDYVPLLRSALAADGLDPSVLHDVLAPTALLHDIGKTRDDRLRRVIHPLTGKPVRLRHPVASVGAAIEILAPDTPHRATILALIDQHSTPYGWHTDFRKTHTLPRHASWVKLDERMDERADGTGLTLLCLFKMADVDGHGSVEDVPWFVHHANVMVLREHGRWLPIPSVPWLRQSDRPSLDDPVG